jgi:hypothetical protein
MSTRMSTRLHFAFGDSGHSFYGSEKPCGASRPQPHRGRHKSSTATPPTRIGTFDHSIRATRMLGLAWFDGGGDGPIHRNAYDASSLF